jgi:hypothetical protein
MDLSKLSDNDLRALKGNNFSALSDEGLVFLKQATTPQMSDEERAERQGFGSAFGSSLSQFATAGMRGAGELLDIESLTKSAKAREARERADPSFVPTTQEDVTKAFEEGILSGAGAAFRQYVSEPAGELAGGFVAPLAVGAAAIPLAPKLGLGALGTFALTGAATALAEFPSAIGDTIQRMEQEGQPVDVGRATAFAIPQAVLYGFGLPGVGVLPKAAQRIFKSKSDDVAERVLAGKLTKEEGMKELSGTLSNIVKETAVAGAAGASVVTGVEALKRGAAGQELTDDEALDAYLEQALAAGAVAPLFGVPIGGFRGRGQKRQVEAAGAQREQQDALKRIEEETAAAQQAELAQRGALFSPEELGGEFVGAADARGAAAQREQEITQRLQDIQEELDRAGQDPAVMDALTRESLVLQNDLRILQKETVGAPKFDRFELQQKEGALRTGLDDLRTRINQAAEARDFGALEALTGQARTLQAELKATSEQLQQAGGAPKSASAIQKQLNSRVKELQKAAAEGDTDKVAALVPKVRELEQELNQVQQAAQPDDLFARADFEESRAQALKVQEEAMRKSDEEREDLRETLERMPDRRLVEDMDGILQRVTQNNQTRFAQTSDDLTRREIAENQDRIEAIKRALEDATAAGDVTSVQRLRNELAQLLTQARQGRPSELIARALTDQKGAVETVRSNLEELVTKQYEGSDARGADTADITRRQLAIGLKDAVASYADAAVRQVNAYRREKKMEPLTNTEATRLVMDVRGRLEAIVGQGNLRALELDKTGGSPVERQLAQLKQKYLKGPSARKLTPESAAARAKKAEEEFSLEGERDVVSPVLRAREETVAPVTSEERTRIEDRLTKISKALNKEYAAYDKAFQPDSQTVKDIEDRLRAARAQASPNQNVISRLEKELDETFVTTVPKNLKKISALEKEYAVLEKRLRSTPRAQRPEVIGVRERALERAEAEARPAEEARLSELERTDPQELQARLDAEKEKRCVRDTRAIRELEEALKASTERQRTVEQLGILGEDRQMQLFGERELEPIATTRATPGNFMRYLRSGEVQKLREASKNTNEELQKELAELRERIKKSAPQAVEIAQSRLNQITKTIDDLETSIQAVWENSPAKAQARLNDAKKSLTAAQSNLESVVRAKGSLITGLINERMDLVERVRQLERPQYIPKLTTLDAVEKTLKDKDVREIGTARPLTRERVEKARAESVQKLKQELANKRDAIAFLDARRRVEQSKVADALEAVPNAENKVASLTSALKAVKQGRGDALKNLDITRASLEEPLARLRKEKNALEKQIAQKMTSFEKAVRESGATPEQIQRAEQAAARARSRAARNVSKETQNKQAAVAEQARLERQTYAPKTVVRTGVVRLDKQRQTELEELQNKVASEEAKEKPNQRALLSLQAQLKKLELSRVRSARARITEQPRYKSFETIDAERRARQAEVLEELADKNLPISTYGVIRSLDNAEKKRAALKAQYDKATKKVERAKQELAARKTPKGKDTAKEKLSEAVEERNSIEPDLRTVNKEIKSLTETYDKMLSDIADARREAGKFSTQDLRPSLKRLEKTGVSVKKDIDAAKKNIASKQKKVEQAKGKDEKTNLQKKLEEAQDYLRERESTLKIIEQSIELKKRKIDRVESLLAIKGNEPGKEERKSPLKVGSIEVETAAQRDADIRGYFKEKGVGWDDYEAPDGTVLRVSNDGDGAKIDPAAASALGAKLEKNIPSNIKFESVGEFSELSARAKAVLERDYGIVEGSNRARSLRGLVTPDGEVFVVRNNHKDALDLETTFAHELIGHVASDRLLGPQGLRKLSDRIQSMPEGAYGLARALGIEDNFKGAMADLTLDVTKLVDAGASNEKITSALKDVEINATRELLAYTAEKRVTEELRQKLNRWYKEIVGVFRDWMRRSGMAELAKVSDADIYNIIRRALRAYNKSELPAHRDINGSVVFRSQSAPNPGFDPRIVSAISKIVPKEKKFYDGVKATTLGMQLMHRFQDRFAGVDFIARTGFKDSLEGVQMMYFNRIADQRSNMVANVVTNGAVRLQKNDKDGTFQYKNAEGASLKSVLQEVGKASKQFGNERFTLDAFGTYLAVERASSDKGGLAAGMRKLDLSGKISMDEAQRLLEVGRGNTNFQNARKMYREYNNGMIDLLVDTGRITKQQAADFKRGDYVPYYRERDGEIWDMEHNVKVGDIKSQPYLRELVGGDSAIVSFETGALQNTYLLTEMSLNNIATKNTAYTLRTLGIAELRDGDGPASPNVIRFYDNGEKKHAVLNTSGNYLKLETELAEMRAKGLTASPKYKAKAELAVKARQSEQLFGDIPADLIVKGMSGMSLELPLAIKFMQGPANLLRKAVTRNPAYAARIALKDSLYGWIATGADVKPVIGVLGNLKKSWTGEQPAIKKLQEQGIIGGHVFNGTVDDMRTVALQLSRGQKGWEKAMAKADRLAILADEAARVTLYDGFIKKGMTELEATLATLEAQNFTKHGFSPSVRYMSTMIPFFNAQIQGLNVFARALAGRSLFEDKLGVQTAALQRGAMLAGGTVLYATMMQDTEAYKNATQEERLNYWFVPVPFFDEPIRVPIPFEAGLVFKALPEAMVNLASADNESRDVFPALRKLALAAIPGSSNLFLPQGAKPLIELATNTSFYGMRPIEGLRAQQEEPGFRAGSRTTEVSKAIGELLNISPLKIDHFISGYTSSTGIALLSAFNPLLRDVDAPTLKASEFSIVGSFFQPTDGMGIINKVYEDMKTIEQIKTTYKRLSERDPAKADSYLQKNLKAIEQGSLAGSFRQEMGELNTAERAIRADRAMSSQEKSRNLDQIKQLKIELATIYRKLIRE